MCCTDGYPYHLNIYTGKDRNNSVPLESRFVKKMVDVKKEHSDPSNHEVYFNVTSYDLLVNLADENVKIVRTVRESGTQGVNEELKDARTLKKSTMGEFDYCNDGKVLQSE